MTWTRNRALGLVHRNKAKSAGGYTLFSPVRGRHADLLDEAGRIVHQWRHPEGIQHLKWLPNGNLLVHTLPPDDAEGAEHIGGSSGALIELDHDSNVVWEYRDLLHAPRLPAARRTATRWSSDGTSCRPTSPPGSRAATWPRTIPTGCGATSCARSIRTGDVVREWRSWEHLSTDHHVKCPLESRKEWTHLNSIELTPDGDWLLSFRLTSTVAIVDGATGDVRWRWGPDVLSHQHHATWLDNGHILVFDNGCHRREVPSFSQVRRDRSRDREDRVELPGRADPRVLQLHDQRR